MRSAFNMLDLLVVAVALISLGLRQVSHRSIPLWSRAYIEIIFVYIIYFPLREN